MLRSPVVYFDGWERFGVLLRTTSQNAHITTVTTVTPQPLARHCNHHHHHLSSKYIGILIPPNIAIDKDLRSYCALHTAVTARYDPRDCGAIP